MMEKNTRSGKNQRHGSSEVSEEAPPRCADCDLYIAFCWFDLMSQSDPRIAALHPREKFKKRLSCSASSAAHFLLEDENRTPLSPVVSAPLLMMISMEDAKEIFR
jgi:hypothetical protein